jgi:hypothetical protein
MKAQESIKKDFPKVEQSPQDTSQIQSHHSGAPSQQLNGSDISSVNEEIVFIDKSGVIE